MKTPILYRFEDVLVDLSGAECMGQLLPWILARRKICPKIFFQNYKILSWNPAVWWNWRAKLKLWTFMSRLSEICSCLWENSNLLFSTFDSRPRCDLWPCFTAHAQKRKLSSLPLFWKWRCIRRDVSPIGKRFCIVLSEIRHISMSGLLIPLRLCFTAGICVRVTGDKAGWSASWGCDVTGRPCCRRVFATPERTVRRVRHLPGGNWRR